MAKCPWTQKQQLVGFSSLTRLELVNFCLCKDLEIEIDWLNTFPWSQLTHVSFTCESFLVSSAVGERLSHLQSLSLSLESSIGYGPGCGRGLDRSLVKQFLMGCGQLSRLKLINCTRTVDEDLFIHLGSTLTDLKLHEYEQLDSERLLLNATQLEQIGKHCPLLRKLAIDIYDIDGWVSRVEETCLPPLISC